MNSEKEHRFIRYHMYYIGRMILVYFEKEVLGRSPQRVCEELASKIIVYS